MSMQGRHMPGDLKRTQDLQKLSPSVRNDVRKSGAGACYLMRGWQGAGQNEPTEPNCKGKP